MSGGQAHKAARRQRNEGKGTKNGWHRFVLFYGLARKPFWMTLLVLVIGYIFGVLFPESFPGQDSAGRANDD